MGPAGILEMGQAQEIIHSFDGRRGLYSLFVERAFENVWAIWLMGGSRV
jgi:hypothetical protein